MKGLCNRYSFDLNVFDNDLKQIINEFGKELRGYNFPWYFFITNNASVSKSSIMQVGLFDENFIKYGLEDWDLGYRLFKSQNVFLPREDILSYHQEHPLDKAYGNTENLFYMCEKHDSIDLYLFYFYTYTSLDKNKVNGIMNDINLITNRNEYRYVLDYFKYMIKEVKNRCKEGKPVAQNWSNKLYEDFDINKVIIDSLDMRSKLDVVDLVEGIYKLTRDLYGIELPIVV